MMKMVRPKRCFSGSQAIHGLSRFAQIWLALAQTAGRVVVLYDDLQRLPDSDCIEAAVAERERVLMVVSGAPDFLDGRTGSLRPLPAARAGIVLAPTGNYDGNAVGLKRLPPDAMLNPRPGRGLLAVGGEAVEIQVPFIDGRPAADLPGGPSQWSASG